MNKYLAVTALFLLSAITGATSQNAGEGKAGLAGVVTDPTGASLPEARVMIVNLKSLQIQTTQTPGDGRFSFPDAPPGEYAVIVAGSDKRFAPCWKPAIRQVTVTKTSVPNLRIPLLLDNEKCGEVVN